MSKSFEEYLVKAHRSLIGRGSVALVVDPSATRNPAGRGTPSDPMTDFEAAYDRLPSGKNAAILLMGGPATGTSTDHSVRLSETLVWAKPMTHLIGICAPTRVGQRARITGPSSGGTFSPVITVSAHGCSFENFSIFDDYGVDPCALKVTGQRNYFGNANVQGMGLAAGSADAAASSLWLNGGAENLFRDCVIGLDTVARSTTNAEILMNGGAKRNEFIDCNIISSASNSGHRFINAPDSGGLDRYNNFIRCNFLNGPTGVYGGATTMLNGIAIHASAGGCINLIGCTKQGCTDWVSADTGLVFIDPFYNGTDLTKQGRTLVAALRN